MTTKTKRIWEVLLNQTENSTLRKQTEKQFSEYNEIISELKMCVNAKDSAIALKLTQSLSQFKGVLGSPSFVKNCGIIYLQLEKLDFEKASRNLHNLELNFKALKATLPILKTSRAA